MGIVFDTRKILTCAHVANRALGKSFDGQEKPVGRVPVTFPILPGSMVTRYGEVGLWHPMGNLAHSDMAVIELDQDIPDAVGVARFSHPGTLRVGDMLHVFGVPGEGIAVIYGVDRILDMARTTVNVLGDHVTATYVARSEGLWSPADLPPARADS